MFKDGKPEEWSLNDGCLSACPPRPHDVISEYGLALHALWAIPYMTTSANINLTSSDFLRVYQWYFTYIPKFIATNISKQQH